MLRMEWYGVEKNIALHEDIRKYYVSGQRIFAMEQQQQDVLLSHGRGQETELECKHLRG